MTQGYPVRRPPMPARISRQQAAGYAPQLPLAEIVRQAAHGKAFRNLMQDATRPQPGDMSHLVNSMLDPRPESYPAHTGNPPARNMLIGRLLQGMM